MINIYLYKRYLKLSVIHIVCVENMNEINDRKIFWLFRWKLIRILKKSQRNSKLFFFLFQIIYRIVQPRFLCQEKYNLLSKNIVLYLRLYGKSNFICIWTNSEALYSVYISRVRCNCTKPSCVRIYYLSLSNPFIAVDWRRANVWSKSRKIWNSLIYTFT